jgi:hypothetical protein
MSESSLRRLTLGSSEKMATWKAKEAEHASAPAQRGENPQARRVAAQDAVREQANVSTDGTMIRIREEGWKEVKIGAISRVEVQPPGAEEAEANQQTRTGAIRSRSRRREEDPRVHLCDHSYCAGLWDADELGLHLYAEGVRRCIDQVERLSSVNDGARWIGRITLTNFPQAVQIVDWRHASERLWTVGQSLYGEGSKQTQEWVEQRLDDLWHGRGWAVVGELRALELDHRLVPDEVRQAPGYFESNLARMRYDQFRAEGYPIGSGTVESGCNNVVQHRMRRPGRGWTRTNANSMLAGLCELHSGRFIRAWQHIHHPQPQSHPYF